MSKPNLGLAALCKLIFLCLIKPFTKYIQQLIPAIMRVSEMVLGFIASMVTSAAAATTEASSTACFERKLDNCHE